MEFCLMIKLKISCVIIIVSSSAPLISSALIPCCPLISPFLRLSNAVISSFMVSSGMCLPCCKCLQVLLRCPSRLFFDRSYLSVDLASTLAMPSLVASMFPDLFLTSVRLRIPLNSSRIYYALFSCLVDLSLCLLPCLIFLLMSLTWALSSLSIFSPFKEGQELLVFAVDRFFFARCRYNCVRLKYFCLFVCDCCHRRHMLLLNKFCHICFWTRLAKRSEVLQHIFLLPSLPSLSSRSSVSDSSFAAASCLPVKLCSSSSYLRSISWSFSDESGSSRGSIDVGYLAYLVPL